MPKVHVNFDRAYEGFDFPRDPKVILEWAIWWFRVRQLRRTVIQMLEDTELAEQKEAKTLTWRDHGLVVRFLLLRNSPGRSPTMKNGGTRIP